MFDRNAEIKRWLGQIGAPLNYEYEHALTLRKRYDFGDFTAELYMQANGPGTFQRLLKVLPRHFSGRLPAVAVPFYFPEAMLGFELETRELLPAFKGIEMLAHLAERGYVAATADAYHLTYVASARDRLDFQRWADCGEALNKEHPEWSGMGKLLADTRLLVNALSDDDRVDADRIGIAGHSLGGKMAFYAGCLDSRIKAIMASDFGFGWNQTNWNDTWYWGAKLDTLKDLGMSHAGLLSCAAPKPFCLLAGCYDNGDSYDMMRQANGYEGHSGHLVIFNHATGHRPPGFVLEKGYDFLDKWLKED